MNTGIMTGLAITILLSACVVETEEEYSQTIASIEEEAATPSIQKPGHIATEAHESDVETDPSAMGGNTP
jgi:hypothetical protein